MTEHITVHGGLTSAPEIRYSQNGVAIASGTVASTERYRDKDGNWQDGKKLYLRYSAFRDHAENIASSQLDKGDKVVVTGKLHTREWEDQNGGGKRSSVELEVTDFAVSLTRATAQVTRTPRDGGNGRQTGAQGQSAADTWGTQAYNDEAPF